MNYFFISQDLWDFVDKSYEKNEIHVEVIRDT